jgi:hypothetical protein
LYAQQTLEKTHISYLASVAGFLETWLGQDEGFARILSIKNKLILNNSHYTRTKNYRLESYGIYFKKFVFLLLRREHAANLMTSSSIVSGHSNDAVQQPIMTNKKSSSTLRLNKHQQNLGKSSLLLFIYLIF